LHELLSGPLNCELFTAEKYDGKDSVELLLGIIIPKNCTLSQMLLISPYALTNDLQTFILIKDKYLRILPLIDKNCKECSLSLPIHMHNEHIRKSTESKWIVLPG
jgi:hypothetical protein